MASRAEQLLAADCVTTAWTADEFNALEVIVKKTEQGARNSGTGDCVQHILVNQGPPEEDSALGHGRRIHCLEL
eukprot:5495391-Ditylum_brightwellii.AAC.1